MANSKTTKRALLTSALAILACVAMLMGATFAWFTDAASTGVNRIQSGNLKVELTYKNKDTKGDFAPANKETAIFDNGALWEPGYVEYAVLNVRNAGSLALKYKLGINIAAETGSTNMAGTDFKLSDYIRFAVLDGDQSELGRDALVEAATAADNRKLNEGYTVEERLLAGDTDSEKTVTLVLWMPTSVGNEANHKTGVAAPSIELGVNVLATQDTVEHDSFDDQYDKDATLDFEPVATAAELKAAIADGKNVSMTEDIQLDERVEIKDDLFIQGNGKTLTAPDNLDNQRVVNLADTTGDHTITLYNVNLEGPTAGAYTRGIAFYNNSGKVKVVMDNCTVSANYYAINVASYNSDIEITVKNSTVTGWCAMQTWSANSKLTFENCTLIGTNDKPYAANNDNDFATILVNTDAAGSVLNFKGCKIVSNQTTGNIQYFLLVNADCTVTFDGCTFVKDGVEVPADQVKQSIAGTGFTLTIK